MKAEMGMRLWLLRGMVSDRLAVGDRPVGRWQWKRGWEVGLGAWHGDEDIALSATIRCEEATIASA
jgi:hypothetical protein